MDVLRRERPRKSIKRGSVRSCFFLFLTRVSFENHPIYIYIHIYISFFDFHFEPFLANSQKKNASTRERNAIRGIHTHTHTQPSSFRSSKNVRQFSCLCLATYFSFASVNKVPKKRSLFVSLFSFSFSLSFSLLSYFLGFKFFFPLLLLPPDR